MQEFPEEARNLFFHGITLYNDENFYEAHDPWEELWMDLDGLEKQFIKGLLHSSVGLYHFGNKNTGGAKKLYLSSRKYLDDCRPTFWNLNVDDFLEQLDLVFKELAETEGRRPDVERDDSKLPTIKLYDVTMEYEIPEGYDEDDEEEDEDE
jgi:predicted metal-dependent hydrolase